MSLFIITEVCFDSDGEVNFVKMAPADGGTNKFIEEPKVVEVDRVVEAIDRLDTVYLVFPTEKGNVSGGKVVRKILAGGHETIQEENAAEGRLLKDMPRFQYDD